MDIYIKMRPTKEIDEAMKRVNEARGNLHEALRRLEEVCDELHIEFIQEVHKKTPSVTADDVAEN